MKRFALSMRWEGKCFVVLADFANSYSATIFISLLNPKLEINGVKKIQELISSRLIMRIILEEGKTH